jgi:hypothetical protein
MESLVEGFVGKALGVAVASKLFDPLCEFRRLLRCHYYIASIVVAS